MIRVWRRASMLLALPAVVLVLTACQTQPTTTATASSTQPSDQETAPTSQTTSEGASSIILTVWLPPDFDPSSGNPASGVLQNRLAEFADQHPQTRVNVRVKAEESTGGLLDSLLAAQAAAPLALPDLVLLPHAQFPEAVAAGLLLPISEVESGLDDDDWYSFGRALPQVDGAFYGLPFAADALIMAYRPSAVGQVPTDWSSLLGSGLQLGFAAADADALFTFTQLSAVITEAAGDLTEPPFSQETLAKVFEFYATAHDQGIFPFWLSQYQTPEQSWQAFTEGRVPLVAAWTSRAFDSRTVDVSASPLPTFVGEPFALVKGWAWAVSAPDLERAQLAMELAEFLTTPEFIAQWTSSAGLLPTRHSSLAAWPPSDSQALASQLVDRAQVFPDAATTRLWGPHLAEAVVALLKQELTPEEALQQVLSGVENQ